MMNMERSAHKKVEFRDLNLEVDSDTYKMDSQIDRLRSLNIAKLGLSSIMAAPNEVAMPSHFLCKFYSREL